MTTRRILEAFALVVLLAGCAGTRSVPATASSQTAPAQSAPLAGNATNAPAVVFDAGSSGPQVGADLYGASLPTWFDFRQRFVNPSLKRAGIHLLRFPGGSESDAYHWEHGGTLCDNQGSVGPGASFDNYMNLVAKPVGSDVAITLNYGSNRACDGGGDPAEAGAWVAHAKSRGERVAFWTVGNEDYGSWEYDLHAHAHDPHTYAAAVRNGYYPAIKSADPKARLGIVVNTPNDRAWNDVVLREAQPFDFVEIHYYPEYKQDDDAFLLGTAIDRFAGDLTALRHEMTAAGVASGVPIYVGEYNNDSAQEGKQSVSIVNGLFVGQMLGTLIEAGVPMSSFWLANGSCDEKGDYSKKLYGWQHFGTEALFSDGLPDPYDGCGDTPKIAGGTPFPTGRVIALMSSALPPGSSARTATVPKDLRGKISAYGVATGGGYALALFNDTLAPIDVRAEFRHARHSSFTATLTVYGKEQYDKSKRNRWVGPDERRLGTVGTTVPLTLPPYSVSVLSLR